jgi:4-hydroxybenzoate polyprenyltransferase
MLLRNCLRLSRWREWAQSKLLFSAGVALLLFPDTPTPLLMVMIATVAPWAAFGYGINEVADRDTDHRAGKLNRSVTLPTAQWALFLFVSAATALGLSLYWAADAAPPLFVVAGMTVAAAYSLPPLRLKERGAIGLVAAATAQWALPVLALSSGVPRGWLRPAAWSLVLLGLAIGLRWIAVHQLADATRDRTAGVRTFATGGGPIWPVIRCAFAAEVVLLATALVLTWPQSMPAILALGGWIVAAELPRLRRGSLRGRLEGYRAAPLRDYYFILLPGSLVLGRMLSSPMPLVATALLLPLGWLGVARMIDRRPSEPAGH